MRHIHKKPGIAGDLVNGIGILIVGVIITLVIVSTLLGANLLRANEVTTTVQEDGAWINETTYTLASFDGNRKSFGITTIVNDSGGAIAIGNYTFTTSTGVLVNATATVWEKVNITYTYVTPTTEEAVSQDMSNNFTVGINNVSEKIPTILLIAAVVILFGVLVILVAQSKKMGIGDGGGSL